MPDGLFVSDTAVFICCEGPVCAPTFFQWDVVDDADGAIVGDRVETISGSCVVERVDLAGAEDRKIRFEVAEVAVDVEVVEGLDVTPLEGTSTLTCWDGPACASTIFKCDDFVDTAKGTVVGERIEILSGSCLVERTDLAGAGD